MEWLGGIALAIVLCCTPYFSKVNRLDTAIKRLERKNRGENNMSKLINDLVNKECKIRSDEALRLVGSTELLCLILDTDDEWIKIQFKDKKKNQITKLLRIENIDEIEVLKTDEKSVVL